MQMVQFPTQTSQQKGGEIISCCNRLWKFWLLLPQGCVDGLIGPVTWSQQNGESTYVLVINHYHAHGIRMQIFGSFLSGMVKGQLKATPEFQVPGEDFVQLHYPSPRACLSCWHFANWNQGWGLSELDANHPIQLSYLDAGDNPWVFPTRGWSWNTTPRSRNELVGEFSIP